MRFVRASYPFSAALILILFLPTSSHAGANAGASAWLSWDEAGLVTELKAVPSEAFPLFVHVKNALDVRALAIHLRWSPFDPLGDCYSVLPATATASCGWAMAIPPGGDFEGDSSYTWSIKFPPLDPNRACVQYLVSAASCGGTTPAADFLLASVLVKDSKGAVDTAQVLDGASILGGSLLGIESVDPREIPARQQTVLTIKGRRFEAGAQVELRSSNLRVAASKVLALGSATITATVLAPDSPSALLDLLVRLPDGRSAQLPAAITIAASPATAQTNPSLSKPTNDPAAFRKFDLYADRITRWNVNDHYGHPDIYPSSLDSDALLVVRSATDTMGIFKSKPYDGIDFNCGCLGFPSYVGYAVTPPQYATSIGLLNMASGVFNGTGEFNDYNVPALSLTWTFTDGDSASQTVRVGKHVRNWRSGSQDCDGPQPYYALPPDSLAKELYAGPLPPPWPPGDAYYDAVELTLAPENRSKKLAALRIAAVDHVDYCHGVNFTSEHFLYGFSIWPNFRIRNRLGEDLPFYSQGGSQPYGGYVIGDSLYGQRKDLSANGCVLSCYAMALKYYGLDYTPATLNAYLQSTPGGYARAVSGGISSVDGYNVTFENASADLKVNTEFLIEQAVRQPLATVKVLSRSGADGAGVIRSRHLPGSIQVGDKCVVYGNIDPGRIIRLGAFAIENYGGSGAPDLVERALTDSFPVILEEPGNPTHFIVAHGWEPAFVSAGSARGTYSVRDPGFNVQRLIQDRYDNKFIAARGLRRKSPSGVPAPQFAATVEEADEALTIGINGPAHAYITDPLGRVIRLDEQLGEYVTSIPDVVADRRLAVDDHDDPATGGEPIDLICLQNAVAGQYSLLVQSEADGVVWVSGSAYHDVTAEAHAALFHVASLGMQAQYRLAYSPGASPTVDLEFLSTTDVPQSQWPEQLMLRLAANPARGQMPLIYGLAPGVSGILDFFDISGRRIRSMQLMGRSSGEQWAWWDGRDDNGVARPSGIYLVRLRAGRDVKLLRGVFLR